MLGDDVWMGRPLSVHIFPCAWKGRGPGVSIFSPNNKKLRLLSKHMLWEEWLLKEYVKDAGQTDKDHCGDAF